MHVHWHEGLFLQPHHLQVMQRWLHKEVGSARSLLNPFCYGILESRISHDDLADGRVRFELLRAIMPSGQEVFYPEEANLPALDIKAEMTRGAGALEIVLAVPLWTKNRANAFRQGETADPRVKLIYIPDEARDLADENTGDNPQVIPVRRVNARIMLKGDDLSDMEFLPLLRVVRSAGEESGKARQDPEFVPPCILLKSAPVLHDLVRDLAAQLNASREQTRIKASTGGLGIELKWELTSRLKTLNHFCASLPLIVEEGAVPPFQVYLELRELLGELLALHPAETSFECRNYNHLDPLPAFKEVDLKIRDKIRVSRATEPLRVQFTGEPGRMRATLEPQHFEKPTGYFLGIKTRVERTKLALYVRDGNKFKFMPRSLEMAAILGVELKEEGFPPLELPGQSDLHYFRLIPSSNQRRWDQVKTDKAASLVWNNNELDLSDASFTLYMTLPT
jgi:type VI secretion system ImpJ/VasE family protein